jgi:hypothetical protein
VNYFGTGNVTSMLFVSMSLRTLCLYVFLFFRPSVLSFFRIFQRATSQQRAVSQHQPPAQLRWCRFWGQQGGHALASTFFRNLAWVKVHTLKSFVRASYQWYLPFESVTNAHTPRLFVVHAGTSRILSSLVFALQAVVVRARTLCTE